MRERKRPGAFGAGSHTTTRLADRQPESAWSLGKVARPNIILLPDWQPWHSAHCLFLDGLSVVCFHCVFH
jgi:hypothetical protein